MTKLTIEQAVALAFKKGQESVRTSDPTEGTNRCKNLDCYLERGHKGPHKPWPPHPNMNLTGRNPS